MRDQLGQIDPSARIYDGVVLGRNVTVGPGATLYENVRVGADTIVGAGVTLGEPLAEFYSDPDYENPATEIGAESLIRSGSVIYAGTRTGPRFRTGHAVMIREFTEFGADCSFGTLSQTDGSASFGDGTKIHYSVHVCEGAKLGRRVRVFPFAAFSESLHPPCRRHVKAPVIGDDTVISIHAHVLPRVTVGARCLVAAHTLVTEDVPDGMMVIGSPGRIQKPAAEIPCRITPGHRPYDRER